MSEKRLGEPLVSLDFSPEETLRYSRNFLLPEVGRSGQQRLRSGRALVVGAGGIGSAALLYLAAAGVGHLGIAEGDTVELSNLQRQILHRVDDVGRPKAESARDSLTALNPHCRVETYGVRLDAANVRETLSGYEVVLDASDNFETRFLVSDCSRLEQIPLISASALGFQGQLLVVDPRRGSPCYRCLMPGPPPPGAVPTSRQVGIMGAVAGVMGCLQALEALKLLLGLESDLTRRLLSYDGLKCRFHTMERVRAPKCPGCGERSGATGRANQANL
jgi:adenylyltransferase/sulfurtransferase